MGMPTSPYLWMMSCLEKPAASNMIEVEVVEHREIARVIDDVGGVAVAPLDLDIAPVHEHGAAYFGAMRSDASSRTTSPLR